MKKITISVAGKMYDINVDDAFADLLSESLKKDFNIDGNNSIKILLEAYLKKNYECFQTEKKLINLLKKVESHINIK